MNNVIPVYDFTAALDFSAHDRMRLCVEQVKASHIASGIDALMDIPPVPEMGASQLEIDQLTADLDLSLPAEYEAFLRQWRYLYITDGRTIFGLDHQGVTIGWPWISEQHHVTRRYLIFGDYWRYADGDQLMFDLSRANQPVVAYLHEDGPLFEDFAPSFSLALWRVVHE